MKQLKIILTTFTIAFALSFLLDLNVIAKNYIRHALVVILIIVTLLVGFHLIKVESRKK
jgi:hypothetical protein